MKFLERFALTIFSMIVLALSVIMLCVMFGVLQATVILKPVYYVMENLIAFRTALVICAVLILLSIKGIFFKSKKENLGKDGIVLENASGKLVISKESLENLVASVAKEIPGAEAVSSRTIVDKDRNLIVYVSTTVSRDMMLKEVSSTLQEKIKEAMKQTADLDVKEVNIRIKNISSKKIKAKSNKKDVADKNIPEVEKEVQIEEAQEVESIDEKTEGEE